MFDVTEHTVSYFWNQQVGEIRDYTVGMYFYIITTGEDNKHLETEQ